jgi:hypothetical protein
MIPAGDWSRDQPLHQPDVFERSTFLVNEIVNAARALNSTAVQLFMDANAFSHHGAIARCDELGRLASQLAIMGGILREQVEKELQDASAGR